MRISDWSSDVCSSDLLRGVAVFGGLLGHGMHLALKVASVEERGVCDQNSGRECAPHRYTVSPATPLRQAAAASGLRGGEALRLKPPQTGTAGDRKSTRLNSSH